ncbi:MAG: hypothetical protein KTR25_18075 [Myxococcales bacterium]|nr:hypothetical protein [Myxococcales bacterium]
MVFAVCWCKGRTFPVRWVLDASGNHRLGRAKLVGRFTLDRFRAQIELVTRAIRDHENVGMVERLVLDASKVPPL